MRMLSQERERQNQAISSHEKELHAMQLNESKLRNDINERQNLEERIGYYKKEIASCAAKSKVCSMLSANTVGELKSNIGCRSKTR